MAGKTTSGTRTQAAASMADSGSIGRLDPHYFNAFSFCLVLNKELQLIKTPVAYPIVHSFSLPLFSYSSEVFHYNLVSIKVGNNAFTDVMVYPLHPTSFSSREFLEQPPAGTSAFGLKLGTQMSELSFGLLDFSRIIKFPAACDSEVVYPEVNTENCILRSAVNGINILGESKQKERSSFFVHSQEAFAYVPGEVCFVAFRDIEFELLPFVEQTQNKNISFEVCISWEIVPDRSVIDNRLGLSLLDHPAGLLDAGDSELGRQCLPQCLINERVELNIIPNMILPCSINTELQSFAVSSDSSSYLWSCSNPDFCCSNNLHTGNRAVKVFKPCAHGCQVASGGEMGNRSKLRGIRP
ncbi:MAG: hypothetical protein QME12_09465, partial [Nanoarchaeota archaeon]|nr:hypothetical protein [Nanoarchaeota archaeon]